MTVSADSRDSIREGLERVHERIARAAKRADRDAAEVSLVAVSKSFPISILQRAIDAGTTDLGENRAQELRDKFLALGDAARWHFVGPLQTNKVRLVVGIAALIHSVESVELAKVISRRAAATGVVQEVLVEVNLSGEETKHGIAPDRAINLALDVHGLDNIKVVGLMTMAPFSDEPEKSRPFFRALRQLRDELASLVPGASALSMGMSRDFEIGVEEGATLVRVGEAIFGTRVH